ncbi:lipoprotein N-acyltransferase Lnb domain-containing protein [Tenacibaculum sp. M341]|uniref:lipoprotein N-acyltransferase Lnb domain-containing protein n=1 Tax=Tenacibaculum sp. M341 TaxID=2530339 RepID=UPI001053986D|nr:DUF4105 domain-containing protein [Tenacibaculum sp. M341]TCI91003.1 DUF4105 domain-containing protein [Tenacibaculum sp. M341]
MKTKLLSLLFLTVFFLGFTQHKTLSPKAEISIVTSGPGELLYEKFGHTAIRVKDPSTNTDILYNYGMFDFGAPNFYSNFTRGYMMYKLVKYPFHYSLRNSNQDERWVKQQVLNLNQEEKNAFYSFLETNALPKNAGYLYDPFFDNCATRPRDIIQDIIKENLISDKDVIIEKTLRSLMNEKINTNTWGSFGINLALGSRLDEKITLNESTYLPAYLFDLIATAKIKRGEKTVPLIKRTDELLKFETKTAKPDEISPFLVFSIFLVLTLLITFRDFKKKKRTKFLDFFIFFSSGIVGVLIIFLWFFTNHSTAPYNYNFLWAFAPNFILSFSLFKNRLKKWFTFYMAFLLILFLLMIVIWIIQIQVFTYPMIPLLGAVLVRYLFLYSFNKKAL